MRVALIDPSFYHQGKLLKMKRVGYFPLTLPRLASLFPATTDIDLYFEKCQEIDTRLPYDLVMFTTMGPNLVRAEELAAEFRRRKIPTVVGGFSVAPFLERCREHFDAAVVGDAEEVVPRLLEDLAQGRLEKVYTSLGPSLDHLPPPRFDLVPPGVLGDVLPVEASRGCPNACAFCAVSGLYQSKARNIPVSLVLRDLTQVHRLGKRLVFFTDPNFTGDMGHAKAVLRGMREIGIKWLASVDIRALADDEFLALAKDSGCFGLQVGFETLHPEELRNLRKSFAAQADYPTLVRKAQDAGIPVVALMMLGFDSDTPATFDAVRRFLEENHLSLAVLHPVIPVPGTPLHAKLLEEGRLTGLDPAQGDGLHLHFRPKSFTPEGFLRGFWNLNRRIFRLRSIVRRFLFPGFLKNPLAYLILLITNLFYAPRLVERRLPMGLYE